MQTNVNEPFHLECNRSHHAAIASGVYSDLVALRLSREEDSLGDTSTLADPSVVETLLSLRGK